MKNQTHPETPAFIAAIGASACCLIPIVALALGGSAGFLAKLDILYFPLAGISVALLLWSWWRVVLSPLRHGEPVSQKGKNRLTLFSAISLLALALPWLLPLLKCSDGN